MKFSRSALFGALSVPVVNAMQGFQTGPLAGSAYASNMIYDTGSKQVFMVGNTYDPNIAQENSSQQANSESSCFLISVDMDYFSDGWDWAKSFGDPQVLESCHGLGLIDPTALVVLGNSEPQGLYSNEVSKLSGFAMALDKSSLDVTSGITMSMSSDNRIPYPIAVTTDEESNMYVVALTSIDDEEISTSFNRATSAGFPNWIKSEKYGTSFDMSVMKMSFEQNEVLGVPDGPSVLKTKWTQEFPIDPESNGIIPRVYIGGIILKNDSFLVVAGSTRGLGPTYGGAVGDDEDGFITLLHPANGQLLQHQKTQSRIGSAEDDLITGICDNPNDPNSFYVVGATKGDIDGIQDDQLPIAPYSLQPFIKKVSVSTLHGIWTVQWGAIKGNRETSAYALGCAVAGDTVYVAGNVEAGAGMVQGYEVQENHGGDDIWIAKLTDSGNDYDVNWVQQLGTAGDDHLARYGGVVTDDDGNAVLYGDTTGSFFRNRAGDEGDVSDVFVVAVEDVVMSPPSDHGQNVVEDVVDSGVGSGDFIDSPSQDSVDIPEVDTTPEKHVPSSNSQDILVAEDPDENLTIQTPQENDKQGGVSSAAGFAIAVLVVVVVAIGFAIVSKHEKNKRADAQKSSTFAYLQQFDVEDIDLRRSPPGGWHGTYLNKLAYGVNDPDVEGPMPEVSLEDNTPSSSHSSIVTDSLFMERASLFTRSPSPPMGEHQLTDPNAFGDSLDDRDVFARQGDREII